MSGKWTPGPLRVVEIETWPFAIDIVDAAGAIIETIPRYAYSTEQKTLADLRLAVGFKYSDRAEVIAANERQLADLKLRAAAPALYEALANTTALLKLYTGNLYADVNKVLADADAALSQALGEGQ